MIYAIPLILRKTFMRTFQVLFKLHHSSTRDKPLHYRFYISPLSSMRHLKGIILAELRIKHPLGSLDTKVLNKSF